MPTFSKIMRFCPYPVVNLHAIDAPLDGFLIQTPDTCRRHFGKNHRCREHYENLMNSPQQIGALVQCPHGFTSMIVATNSQHFAITGLIPYPRIGGSAEKIAAKNYPHNKVPTDAIITIGKTLRALEDQLAEIENDAVTSHAMALHEIRKLNRNVKQTAERLCRKENAESPELASKEIVQIWKSAEIMSQQFDIIEMLANESLTQLPLNSMIEVYRIFDKCSRIYNSVDGNTRVALRASTGFSGRIQACDKTFPIIPTVLIENALKYGKRNGDIDVYIHRANNECVIEVTNIADTNPLLNDSIFEKGKRATQGKEGSGHGLYLAQLVARQHGSTIMLSIKKKSEQEMSVRFSVTFPLV
jgi:hypothetical protein